MRIGGLQMSVVFLIGNGFDINCGINSRYQNIYDRYVLEPSKSNIIDKFKKELLEKNIDTWGDFEVAMAKYASLLSSEEELLECLRDFKKFMIRYLIEEQVRFHKMIDSDNGKRLSALDEIENSINTFYKGASKTVDSIFEESNYLLTLSVISFNYTDAFDTLFHAIHPESKLIHIHGEIGIDGSDVAIGMDNELQLNLPYEISQRGKRAFLKPIYNQEYDSRRIDVAKKIIEHSDAICIFGMSLGESDYTWRELILSQIEKRKAHVIIYRHHMSKMKNLLADEKMDYEDAEKERLLEKWDIPIEQKYLDYIHIPSCRNIFNIKEVLNSTNK